MAERVGPAGRVLGLDADASLGVPALAMLHGAGYPQCAFGAHDLTAEEPIPGAPFDLVYARLLLFHLPRRAEVLARLWAAVADGGYLLIQDYDLRSVSTLPQLGVGRRDAPGLPGAFGAAGADPSAGTRLPQLFAQAGLGDPDGTDVAGRVEPLAAGRVIMEHTFRSIVPAALAHGVTTAERAAATLAALDRDVTRFPDRPLLWPLLVSAWKRKDLGPGFIRPAGGDLGPVRLQKTVVTEGPSARSSTISATSPPRPTGIRAP